MQLRANHDRWLPIAAFLVGVGLTASTIVALRHAQGQERVGTGLERPPVPPDPRSPQALREDALGGAAAGQGDPAVDTRVDFDEGGIEALYNAVFRRRSAPLPEEVGELPTPEQLARERYELAGAELESAIQRFLEPAGGPGDFGEKMVPVLEWSRYRTDARLDMAGSGEERIAALRKEIAHTRAILATLRPLSQGVASMITPKDMRELDLYRLELEYRLAELTRE